jgi:hypothetical protein
MRYGLLALALLASACAYDRVPDYPATWARLRASGACPNLTGRFESRASADAAPGSVARLTIDTVGASLFKIFTGEPEILLSRVKNDPDGLVTRVVVEEPRPGVLAVAAWNGESVARTVQLQTSRDFTCRDSRLLVPWKSQPGRNLEVARASDGSIVVFSRVTGRYDPLAFGNISRGFWLRWLENN